MAYRRRMTTVATDITLAFTPIPTAIADEARATRKDGFGHDLVTQTGERSPCRMCLEISTPDEELLLMSYRPLDDDTPYAEIGPVFIHARACPPYEARLTFPPAFASRELVIRAYGYDGRIVDATVARAGGAPAAARAFLMRSDVREVHVRHVSYTCYDFKITRS